MKTKKGYGLDNIAVKSSDSGRIKKDYTGSVFGIHKVLKHVGFNSTNRSVYLCEDIFGQQFTAHAYHFRKEYFKTRFFAEASKEKRKLLNRCYRNMIKRCYTPDSLSSKYYYHAGVKVCDEWLGPNGFFNFLSWAAANGYEKGLTLDKRDKLYSPNTCRWISRLQNCRETRHTRMTEDKVRELKREAKLLNFPLRKQACEYFSKKYEIATSTVAYILRGARWGDIHG